MEDMWDVPYISYTKDIDGFQEEPQEAGAIDSEPIELGIIYLSDSSSAESVDEEMIDNESHGSEAQGSLIQAAQTPPPQDTTLHPNSMSGSPSNETEEPEVISPGGMQIETRPMAAAKQNLSTETNTSVVQSEMEGSSKRVNDSEPKSASPNNKARIPDIPYDEDLPLEAKHLPCIKFEKAYTYAIRDWEPRIKSTKWRLKRKARPFTELEDTWEKYVEYAKCVLRGGSWNQNMYLEQQTLAMVTFAKHITPRVRLIYARNFYGSERDVFFDALDKEILSWNGSPKR